MPGLYKYVSGSAPKMRNVFFSFHYDDIMRVNNVRMSRQFQLSVGRSKRHIEGYYDYSLWESKKRTGVESLKDLIRSGVQNTSAVCVLAGTNTYSRPWVRYEIARAIIDGRGLLTVYINNLQHIINLTTNPRGPNPLDYMAIISDQNTLMSPPTYNLCEWDGRRWVRYSNYTQSVSLPSYLTKPVPGSLVQLSAGTQQYDYVTDKGSDNLGSWIDHAARQVGR